MNFEMCITQNSRDIFRRAFLRNAVAFYCF